jgi:putative DNA methylase
MWENDDLVPRPDDIFQERLYCIRWVEPIYNDDGELSDTCRHYSAPTAADMRLEEKALSLLRERFCEWQEHGFIPSRVIEPGAKTNEPIRTRGWTHWHHLFSPRQLLIHGLILATFSEKYSQQLTEVVQALLLAGSLANRDSRLVGWVPSYESFG